MRQSTLPRPNGRLLILPLSERPEGTYNYGYRDYRPQAARFTTVDPVRDGHNWFAYTAGRDRAHYIFPISARPEGTHVNNDPVNWIDLWGLQKTRREMIEESNAAHISTLDPSIQDSATNMFSDLNKQGVDAGIVSSYRTVEEQNELYQQGRDADGNEIMGQKTVTDAKGGESLHNSGMAFDVEVYKDLDKSWEKDWDFEGPNWQAVRDAAENNGFEAGYYWEKSDEPHFQKSENTNCSTN